MPKLSKMEVSAINIRIPDEKKRDYDALLVRILGLKSGVRVYGNTYLAITDFDVDKGAGIISKYSEIDLEGDWFNVDEFDIASDADTRSCTHKGFRDFRRCDSSSQPQGAWRWAATI